jgi:hypothetical protein
MHGQSITLHVPDALYDRLKQRGYAVGWHPPLD